MWQKQKPKRFGKNPYIQKSLLNRQTLSGLPRFPLETASIPIAVLPDHRFYAGIRVQVAICYRMRRSIRAGAYRHFDQNKNGASERSRRTPANQNSFASSILAGIV